ncbi:hypothetical protein ER308_00345 [Egibacter rhizosphaerae]|uniref:SRPBCC family protein n=1 Tax=Egibacter rhizosphaerae TaxID=1670831 RepID=A0A411YAG6_9ACTN|nr:hypothetical protein [Egibacter rhizosphaerae]QBI18172.1 hypothetical protein ER308_00345 [Egibacter rhizosphaerae]
MSSRRIETSDDVFVRARRRDVHPYLLDVAGYGAWWPGCRARPAAGGAQLLLRAGGHPRLTDPLRWGRARVQRVWLQPTKVRPDLGIDFSVRGDLVGTAEWYYLDEPDGVTVHWLLHAVVRHGSPGRTQDAHRAAVRAGLHALKDLLESGRYPGQEPSAALLEDQQDAIAAFEEGVRAHRAARTNEPARTGSGRAMSSEIDEGD